MDYAVSENRPFFFALFRHACFVASRGCWHTALEVTKLLLALEPADDPLATLLMIDYFAVRAQEYEYLIALYNEWNPRRQLEWLPNFAYMIALAYYLHSESLPAGSAVREQHLSHADTHLQTALQRFPGVIVPLMRKCGTPLPSSTGDHAFYLDTPLTESEKNVDLLCELLIDRAFTMWKLPGVFDWVQVCGDLLLVD